MPYIKQEKRDHLELDLVSLADFIECAGDLNYVITRLLNEWIKRKGQSYQVYNDFIGALECCKLEAYRRKIAPYEDIKIEENGDV